MSFSVKDSSDDFSPTKEVATPWGSSNEQNLLKSRKDQDFDSFARMDQFLRVEPSSHSSSEDSYKSSFNELCSTADTNDNIPQSQLTENSRRLSFTLTQPSAFLNSTILNHSLLENVTPPSAYSKVSNLTLSESPCSGLSFVCTLKKRLRNSGKGCPITPTSAKTLKKSLEIINEHVSGIGRPGPYYGSGKALAAMQPVSINFTVDSGSTPSTGGVEGNAIPPSPSQNVTYPLGGTELNHEQPEEVVRFDDTQNILDLNVAKIFHPDDTVLLDMTDSDHEAEPADNMELPTVDFIERSKPSLMIGSELTNGATSSNEMKSCCVDLLEPCSTPNADRGSANVDLSKTSPIIDSNIQPPRRPSSITRRETFVILNSRVLKNFKRLANGSPQNRGINATTSLSTKNVCHDDTILLEHSKKQKELFPSNIRKPRDMPIPNVMNTPKECRPSPREIDVRSISILSKLIVENCRPHQSRIPLPARMSKMFPK